MKRGSDAGFTLVEALVSTAFIAVAVLGMATLMAVGTDMQTDSRDSAIATNLAIAEMEWIRRLPPAAPQRQNGGSLANNVTDYFVTRGRTTIRWVIADGPACGQVSWAGTGVVIECSKLVTVRAFTVGEARTTQATIQGVLWR